MRRIDQRQTLQKEFHTRCAQGAKPAKNSKTAGIVAIAVFRNTGLRLLPRYLEAAGSWSISNATLTSHLCGLCDLSAAGVEMVSDRKEICHAPKLNRTSNSQR
jgi:hypothetical protein